MFNYMQNMLQKNFMDYFQQILNKQNHNYNIHHIKNCFVFTRGVELAIKSMAPVPAPAPAF